MVTFQWITTNPTKKNNTNMKKIRFTFKTAQELLLSTAWQLPCMFGMAFCGIFDVMPRLFQMHKQTNERTNQQTKWLNE